MEKDMQIMIITIAKIDKSYVKVKVKQSCYRPGVSQRVQGS
jgi:hypothetical protein